MEYIKLTIDILNAEDRREMFERSCELLSLNSNKEAKNIDIERGREGYVLSTEKLMIFCAVHSIHGQFDFRNKEKLFSVFVPENPSVGKVAIDAPKTIKATSVDVVESKDPESDTMAALAANFKSVEEVPDAEQKNDLPSEEEEDEDDEPF